MRYLLFVDRGGRYGDEQNLEEHLKMCERCNATPDCWDTKDTLQEAFLTVHEQLQQGLELIVVDSNQGHIILE